jgi:hypothetical protein
VVDPELELPEPEDAAPLVLLLLLLLVEELEAALTVVFPADTDWPDARLTCTTVPGMGDVRSASARLALA